MATTAARTTPGAVHGSPHIGHLDATCAAPSNRSRTAAHGTNLAPLKGMRTTYILAFAGAAALVDYVMRSAQVRAQDQHREECLDTALADTFPASDPLPVSVAQTTRTAERESPLA